MSTGKRGADLLNVVGVVTIGICGAVLTYVSIVALQAVYMNDTAEKHAVSGYKNQTSIRTSLKASQMTNIGEYRGTQAAAGAEASYRVPIDRAMELVVRDAARDPANLVPNHPSTTPSILPVFGRPQKLPDPVTPPADAPATVPADGTVPASPDATLNPPADPAATGNAAGGNTQPTGDAATTGAPPPAAPSPAPGEQPKDLRPGTGAATGTGTATGTGAPAAPGGNGQ